MSTDGKSTATESRARECVLLVIDDVVIRMVIADYLRRCGYRVIEAASSDEALIVLKNGELRVDVMLSAMELTNTRDGFALSHWVRENRPSIEVIMAGSLARAANSAGELCQQGPHNKKPNEHTSIIAEVNQLLAAARRSPKTTGL